MRARRRSRRRKLKGGALARASGYALMRSYSCLKRVTFRGWGLCGQNLCEGLNQFGAFLLRQLVEILLSPLDCGQSRGARDSKQCPIRLKYDTDRRTLAASNVRRRP